MASPGVTLRYVPTYLIRILCRLASRGVTSASPGVTLASRQRPMALRGVMLASRWHDVASHWRYVICLCIVRQSRILQIDVIQGLIG